MNKRWLVASTMAIATLTASSQTLFTYGKHSTDSKDFLRAYNKNNAQPATNKSKAVADYLDLYINSRLKIQEAYQRGYDTLPQIRSEVDNLRTQIIENYMSDPKAIDRLTKEAFQRSLKDIHAAHIFISFKNAAGTMDTVAANQKLVEVQRLLTKGTNFMAVAQQFSDDPSAKTNKGDIGFITVLTLPYIFENVIYTTSPGKHSQPFRSKIGYHIFKNIEERKAVGRIKAQQILLAFPPGADDATKKRAAILADSLHRRIVAGDDFGKLAATFSNDYVSGANNGNIPNDISVGQYDAVFEKQAWTLAKDGAVSKPFITSHGYHIIKRVSAKPIVTNPGDKANMDEIKQKILLDDRWKTAKDFIYERVSKNPGITRANYNDAVLWALTDSLLDYKPAGIGRQMNLQSQLFTIGHAPYNVVQWVTHAQMNRYKTDRSGLKDYTELMDEFVKASMYEYYRAHLEDYSEEFRIQMSEFRDGNLFFEIMQQEIWNRTQNDSTELWALYKKNASKYHWKPSADAIIFFCADAATAKALYDQVKKDPSAWKKAAEAFSEKVVTDSSRYEWEQIPGLEKTTPKAGILTAQAVNASDNTASFAFILKIYTESSPRSFNEAKGLVMNDYQALLEERWIQDLRKKYPVVIDQKVLTQISK